MAVRVVGVPDIDEVVNSTGLISEADVLVEFHPVLPTPLNEERVTVETSETVRVRVIWVVLVRSGLTREKLVEA